MGVSTSLGPMLIGSPTTLFNIFSLTNTIYKGRELDANILEVSRPLIVSMTLFFMISGLHNSIHYDI